jgi:hypothetical protein
MHSEFHNCLSSFQAYFTYIIENLYTAFENESTHLYDDS